MCPPWRRKNLSTGNLKLRLRCMHYCTLQIRSIKIINNQATFITLKAAQLSTYRLQ